MNKITDQSPMSRLQNNQIVGYCQKCGAPYYGPAFWHGVGPVPVTPTCVCWNLPKIITTDIFNV